MKAKFSLLATALVLASTPALAGPCTDRISQLEKTLSMSDAGSGPTAKTTGQSAGDVAATPRQAPKAGETPDTGATPAMNATVGAKAASPADVRAQTQGAATAAQTAQTGGGNASSAGDVSSALAAAKSADAGGDAAGCKEALDRAEKLIKG